MMLQVTVKSCNHGSRSILLQHCYLKVYTTSNLVELSTEATEINGVTCNYGNLVSMATELYLHWFAIDSIQAFYLEHMSLGKQQYLVVLSVLGTLLL